MSDERDRDPRAAKGEGADDAAVSAPADETAAAEALARALDGTGGPDVPEDALQIAALLRYSTDGGALDPERKDAIREELLDAMAARPSARPGAGRSWRRWLWPAGGLALAGAAALAATLLLSTEGVSPRGPAELPRPQLALLQAQSRATTDDVGALADLRQEMTSYRREMYSALASHYAADADREPTR